MYPMNEKRIDYFWAAVSVTAWRFVLVLSLIKLFPIYSFLFVASDIINFVEDKSFTKAAYVPVCTT